MIETMFIKYSVLKNKEFYESHENYYMNIQMLSVILCNVQFFYIIQNSFTNSFSAFSLQKKSILILLVPSKQQINFDIKEQKLKVDQIIALKTTF